MRSRLTPVAVTAALFVVGYLQKLPCHLAGWPRDGRLIYGELCYSDIPFLYKERGFGTGAFAYELHMVSPPVQSLEYPALTGLIVDAMARLARLVGGSDVASVFYVLNVGLLFLCAVVAVLATAAMTDRPWDALLVAGAPVLALTGTINWDLVPVALTALAVLTWARNQPLLTGVLLGLGTAAKLYPAFLLGPILVLCLRSRRLRAFFWALGGAVVAWLAVNVPLMVFYPAGWAEFWEFNSRRGGEFGSPWYAFHLFPDAADLSTLNLVASGLFLLGCLAVAWLGFTARREPTLAQLSFLVLVAFLVTNKVYSPQYVLWLLPLAVLARPNVRDWAIWQAGEIFYWVAIWLHLSGDIPGWLYPVAVGVRIAVTLYYAAMVVRDIRAASAAPAASPVDHGLSGTTRVEGVLPS